MKYWMIENHPMDCRVRVDESGTCQTLPARMGTGGGNVPLVLFEKKPVLVPVCVMETSCVHATFTDGRISPTVFARAGTGGNQLPLVVLKPQKGELR